MKYIKTYQSYKESSINEEFIGSAIKGALSGLFKVFAAPFKDLANDIKKSFKDDDPNSIKGIILTNLDQAIDGIQKNLRNKNLQEGDITDIMNKLIDSLRELSKGIGKDFSSAIGDKTKSGAASKIARAILLGSKEAGWNGIVGGEGPQAGLLSNPNYKYSKAKYELALAKASEGKTGDGSLKAKIDTAYRFFDELQKDIITSLDKELTEEEMQKIYNDAKKEVGGKETFSYYELKEFFDKKIKVKYKREGYDDNKNPEEQKEKVGIKLMDSLDDEGKVTFKTEDGGTFVKKYEDILGPAEENIQKDVAEKLGKIKADKEKMSNVDKFVDILNDPNKKADLNQITKILNK
jgi:uncharacterized protein YqeY